MSDYEKNSAVEQEKSGTPESLRILEAVLFASDDVLSIAKLREIIPDTPDARTIRKMVDNINIQLQRERHPFEVVELGGGYQFRTIPYYQPWVQQVFKEKSTKKVSIQGLECLAIIAYKQPISKTEIETIRGVLSDGAMKTLLERRLITISGRGDGPGRPLLYSTTPEFLTYFGINKLSDLPKLEEFEAMAREKMEDIPDDELEALGIPPEEDESDENDENQCDSYKQGEAVRCREENETHEEHSTDRSSNENGDKNSDNRDREEDMGQEEISEIKNPEEIGPNNQ